MTEYCGFRSRRDYWNTCFSVKSAEKLIQEGISVRFPPRQSVENQQLIDYYIPTNCGIRVDDQDILSYLQLGDFLWEDSGIGHYSVPPRAKTTARIIAWLNATESDTHFFETGLEKETTHRHTPSVMIEISYERFNQEENPMNLDKIKFMGKKAILLD